ncbi:Hpt domain-containing protein [Ramlibacter ginsenosidimutans]|uniref:Hpt domain-containing protein n=1 Tax=Ramlibacter ginsenosidimutans TaxID=502333 RepID=A0A934U062_9BURK|nr:Hpt domain-containing protein [Ramlibacter ginsenosidimutans]
MLHRLAGSAGTFGLPALGEACRAIELQLDDLLHCTNGRPAARPCAAAA